METVSSIYLEGMGNMVRKPSRMRLTFHYPTGDIVYNNADIVKVTEKKTAHLIAGELPAVELEMELVNLDGSFNPNDISGLHDLIVKGVPVTYEFGYDIPNLQYYGYTDGEEHDYGMEENVPYGFMEGYATEWIPGGEVFTSGEISYSKTTATISAKDYLSFLDEHVLLAYGNRTLAQVAKAVLSLTDYPKEDDGDPKIITGPELDAFNTAITLSETEDESISAKEHLQTIAHACGVQMYIDRGGYIHLDNDKRGVSAVYSLPLGQQGEQPEHRKEQMPKKVVITLNSEYGDPVETDLNGGGETMTVENPFIVTTAEGETLSGIVYDHFIKYRNTADVPYRGEPALDILDTIALGTEFGGDVEAIVVGTELEFDGTLSGSLSVRYQLGGNTPEKVQIKGSGNFIYPLGEDDEPSITSFNLLCETTFPTPTYQWSYFAVSNGSWLNIAGATSNTLTVAYNSSYYDNDSSVKFRCVVNNTKGAITQISKIQLQKSETSGYRGTQKAPTREEIDVPSPQIGDVVLLDNTDNTEATVYGEAHTYNGGEWVPTQESDALAMTYKDALQLAKDSQKTIYASEIYADLIVTKNLVAGEGNGTAGSGFRFRAMSREDLDSEYNETTNPSVFDVMYDDRKVFDVDPESGNVMFGDYTTGNGIRWENDTSTLAIQGSGKFTGTIDHEALTTRDAVASQVSVNLATKTAYYGQDLFNGLSSLGTGAWVNASGSFKSIGFSQIALLSTTEQKAIIVDSSVPNDGQLQFVSKYTGSVRFIFEARPGLVSSGTVNLYINGVLISSTRRPAFSGATVVTVDRNVAEGDVIKMTTSGNAIYFKMYIRGVGIALNMGSRYVSIKTNSYYNNRFILSSPKSVDSNNHMTYVSAEAVIGSLSALTPNRSYPTTSGSSISVSGGGAKSVTSIMRSSESVVIETTSGTVYLATASQEGVSGYDLSGTITIDTSEASLRTLTVLPKQDNTHSLGSLGLNLYYSDLFVSSLVGMISAFASSATPSGWLECNGQAVSRTTYSKLYSSIGTTFGSGNGSTTFNVPDLRGEFIRGWSHGRSGVDDGRTIGSFQDQSIQSHAHSYKFSDPYSSAGQSSGTSASKIWEEDRTTGYTGGAETRPRNVALMYCIKY